MITTTHLEKENVNVKKITYITMGNQQPSSFKMEKVQRSGDIPHRNQAISKSEAPHRGEDMIRSYCENNKSLDKECSKEITTCTVYGLRASDEDHCRYIGQTTQSLRRRLSDHMCAALHTGTDSYVYRWIRKKVRQGHKISICVIEKDCKWNSAEIKWISYYKAKYSDMTNVVSGGEQGNLGRKLSEATKNKMRKPKSEQARKNMKGPRAKHIIDNLKRLNWGNTYSQGSRNRHAVLDETKVKAIKVELKKGRGVTDIAKDYGVQKSAISKIKTGRTWKHVK